MYKTKVTCSCFLIVLLGGAAGDVFSLENNLELLRPYLNDQQAFEQKIRSFEKLHLAIAHAELERASQLESQGLTEEAQAARQKARASKKMIMDAYKMGLAQFNSSSMLHLYYGEFLHDHTGRVEEAESHWLRAIDLDETNARAHNNLGMHFCHVGKYAVGFEHLDKSLALRPDNPDFLFNTVQAYLTHFIQLAALRGWSKEEIYRRAMELSEKAITLSPNDYQLQRDYALNFFLGENFGVTVDWRQAAKAWQLVRQYATKDVDRYNALVYEARAHIRAQDKESARRCLEQADALKPNDPVVLGLLKQVKN